MNQIKAITKRMGRLLHIYIPIYDRHIYYVSAKTEADFIAIAKRTLNLEIHPDHRAACFAVRAYRPERNKVNIGIIWTDGKHLEHLVHETLHATLWIMDSCSMHLSNNWMEDETNAEQAFCLLQEYLFKTILDEGRKK